MQVSQQDDFITHAVIGNQETVEMGVSDDAALMHILSSTLYTHPKLAVVREIICNGWDAHIAAGKTDTPLQITINSSQLTVRDFGFGIAHAEIGPIYGVYGNSTKRGDSKSTGGFGLGSKAPFAYTDNFEVSSHHLGVKTVYRVSKSSMEKGGKPSINKIVSLPTDETGIAVSFGIQAQDQREFLELIREVLILGEIQASINGADPLVTLPLSTSEDGVFVDCHSKNVKQKVGSKVFMSEALVDPDRSTECSNGLHVARRDYLSSFSGNVCVLAKLAPEDVIAVPHRDPRKLRAKGYHIIAQLSEEDANLVCRNKPMKDTVLLGNAAAGNHVGVLETVEITQQRGGGLIITPVAEATEVVMEETKQAVSLDELPEVAKEASSVDAAKVAKQVVTERKSGRQQQAETLLKGVLEGKTGKVQIQKAKELLAFKKAAKVSWDKLGISESQVASITAIANGAETVAPAAKAPKAKKAAAASKPAEQVITKWVGTPRERIRKLIEAGIQSNASNIVSIKKAAKKSWSALGVTEAEEKQILSAA